MQLLTIHYFRLAVAKLCGYFSTCCIMYCIKDVKQLTHIKWVVEGQKLAKITEYNLKNTHTIGLI